ncbi:MAG: carboxypeptidase regulatory-like domain-containing protein [Acidobacteriota bacterium]
MQRFRVGVASVVVLLTAVAAAAQTSSVSGKVTNKEGAVVANATVSLVPPPSAMASMPGMRPGATDISVQSGADGTFQFDKIPAGQFILQVDAPGQSRSSQQITVPTTQALAISLEPLEVPGAEASPTAAGAAAAAPTVDALLERIRTLEQRLTEFESTTVLSEPETRVKRIEIWVDKDGNQYDHQVAGSKREVTYERERAYRRQTINEKIEQALSDEKDRNVGIGVDATTVTQFAGRTTGDQALANKNAYALASADLFFTAKLAQHTIFFADVVALSGSPPDRQIPTLTLLNGYTARLVNQNELNLREAWLRTEFFGQRLALVAGRLDLTNYFDHNAAANDETTQFLADALVNNPTLGLSSNGTGFATVFDPKNGFNFKFGIQQSNPDADNLSDSIYSLAEAGYVARPPGLGEGNYRVWYRWDNSAESRANAVGISLDQRLFPRLTVFARVGSAEVLDGHDRFYSAGVQIQNGLVFNPLDSWGIGYAQINPFSGRNEKLFEGYYNFRLTERLRLSFNLERVLDSAEGDQPKFGYFLPGVRLQASF